MSTNRLYYGDNLEVLRNEIQDESIDLIYLDPPFNSNANYNILFKSPKTGESSHSQIEAFDDTWHWGPEAQKELDEIVRSTHTEIAELIQALRHFLQDNDMMAYLVMMASRLVELHRVLKSTGSLYLHCDPTASHYLKLVLDAVFGFENFRNEIIWRRTGSHNKARRFAPIHDTIFYYVKSSESKWSYPKRPYMRGHVEKYFINENNQYKTNYYGNVLTGSGIRNGDSGKPWKGFNPTEKGRHWAIPGALLDEYQEDISNLSVLEKLDFLYEKGSITIIEGKAWPMYEHIISDKDGQPISDIWAFQPYTENTVFGTEYGIDEDVRWLSPQDRERLGYPTQKPVGLLERIISASSTEGDTILDPFCGCGTAVHAAEKLNRKWIGIDITNLSISLIERRMKEAFPDVKFEVHGTPKDLESARDLAIRDKYQFQWWAISLISAQPYKGKKKGADSGIDGLIFFKDDQTGIYKKIVVSVKGGEHINVAMIRDLKGTVEREKAVIGIFITLAEPTEPMRKEASSAPLYKSPLFPQGIFPSIQILTIEGLMNKTQKPEYPNLYLHDIAFKRTEREAKSSGGQNELF